MLTQFINAHLIIRFILWFYKCILKHYTYFIKLIIDPTAYNPFNNRVIYNVAQNKIV